MKALALVLLAAATLTACGPQKTSVQKDNEEIADLVKQEEAKYAPLAGTYVGTMIAADDGSKVPVQLTLTPLTVAAQNASRFGTSPIPSIGGSMFVCISATDNCFADKKSRVNNSNKASFAAFNVGYYEPQTQRLKLLFNVGQVSNGTGGSNAPSGASTQFSLDGIADGDSVKGNFWSSVSSVLQPVDLKRVK